MKNISTILSGLNTDKNRCVKRSHCYGRAYDLLFKPFDRLASLDIVEIGTEYGDSLLAWKKFFPHASVSGIDIEDRVENKHPEIKYIISDVNIMGYSI